MLRLTKDLRKDVVRKDIYPNENIYKEALLGTLVDTR